MNKRWYGGALGFCLLLAATTSMAESLQQAWNVALQVNHGLKAARENSSAAARQLEAAKAVRLPGLSLEAGYTMLQNEPATRAKFGPAAAEFPIGERNTLSYKAMATLPLYTGGRISRGIDAAESAVRASRGQESAAIQDLKRTVAEAYVAVLRARRGVEVADSHVASLKAHARDVENMYEQGMVSRNDLLAAQVALADAQQQAIKAKNALDLARSTYNRLLDKPLSQEVVLDDLQPGPLDEGLESLTERALGQRDELLVLQDRIRGLQDQAKAVRAETAPQLALSGGYDYRENRYTVYEGQWMVNLGLQWRLFDGGATRHKAAATERQAAALQQQYDDLRAAVALEVRRYWLDVQETRKRIRVTEKAIARAEENLKVNRERYENGLATNTEVLDAEALRTLSESNHANAIYDAVLAILHLKRAVGEL